ncbi:hypothetical protein J7T55_003431 [Diaporthe amygdali]|uniref:uncharacterized protein n=1 Tax=Phomopsis amygdali TaxID=1214568 RepID=UPI0022FE2485|nr:uncharacterized protein J7T55_003431 [Diaporthe amygdali]KAJ0117016.1 hypothetical protein J7T55_003431 [Diaporthe amygdali]
MLFHKQRPGEINITQSMSHEPQSCNSISANKNDLDNNHKQNQRKQIENDIKVTLVKTAKSRMTNLPTP